jgi:hypothetical protein
MAEHRSRFREVVVITNARGSRGVDMNRVCGEILARRLPEFGTRRVLVSACEGEVEDLYRVLPEERAAFLEALGAGDFDLSTHRYNEQAIRRAMRELGPGDLLLVVGTYGFQEAGPYIQDCIRRREKRWFRRLPKGTFHTTDREMICRAAVIP